jgi:Integral membrane protein TerC family
VPFKEAMWLSAFWIAISLAFGSFVWAVAGPAAGGEYLAAYLLEKSLSLDNVFVFAVIFSAFAVPRKYRYHVLFWGVVGALVARFVFILAGTSLLAAFDWLVFVFGAFLLFTALRMFRGHNEEADPKRSRVLGLVRRVLPTTGNYRGDHFFVREYGKLYATPLLAVLVVVETTDILFAVDSRACGARRYLQRLHRVLFERLRRVGPEGAVLRGRGFDRLLRLPTLRACGDPDVRGGEAPAPGLRRARPHLRLVACDPRSHSRLHRDLPRRHPQRDNRQRRRRARRARERQDSPNLRSPGRRCGSKANRQ